MRKRERYKATSRESGTVCLPHRMTHRVRTIAVGMSGLAAVLFIMSASCREHRHGEFERGSQAAPVAEIPASECPGLDHVFRLSDRLISGSEPVGDAGFESLAKMGVRTIASVDGGRPDVAAAHAHGLRYVHLPIGYDGVPPEICAALAYLAETSKAPIYVHCYHGKHRGPAAAAIIWRAQGDADARRATEFMRRAGTSQDYTGLWRDVEAYDPAHDSPAVAPPLPEVADVGSFITAMANVGRTWDRIKLLEAGAWATLAEHPDIAPNRETEILAQRFEACRQQLAEDAEPQLRASLEKVRTDAEALHRAVAASDKQQANAAYGRIKSDCKQCHRAFRN